MSLLIAVPLAVTPALASAAEWYEAETPITIGPNELNDLSCTSSTHCIGVGYVEEGKERYVRTLEWNGEHWLQGGAGGLGIMKGVSCTSSTACIGVGEHVGGPPLAESYNGTKWTTQTVPKPEGAVAAHLEDVSCASSTACEAVGDGLNTHVEQIAFAEGWNGTEWQVQAIAKTEGKYPALYNIACTSATSCIAVGRYNGGTVFRTLAEIWNGTEWKLQSTPNPKEGSATLTDISCSSSTACMAVGSQGEGQTLSERWNGTEWAIKVMPLLEGTKNALSGVSCSSSVACTAVGQHEGRPLAEFWNGSNWSEQKAARGPGLEGHLSAVACSSSTSCDAVGGYLSGERQTLAEVYK